MTKKSCILRVQEIFCAFQLLAFDLRPRPGACVLSLSFVVTLIFVVWELRSCGSGIRLG